MAKFNVGKDRKKNNLRNNFKKITDEIPNIQIKPPIPYVRFSNQSVYRDR